MSDLLTEYTNAVNSGNTQQANYLAQVLASNAGININANEVTAAPASMVNANSSTQAQPGDLPNSAYFGNFWTNLLGTADSLTGGAASTAVGAAQTAKGGLSFITDIPRVGTTLIGGLMIAAGIFALAGGSHKDIIQLTKAASG